MKSETKGERLFSLDLLRGFDMLFLLVVEPIVSAWHRAYRGFDYTPAAFAANPVMRQMTHNWSGFTCYDVIMPLFIFMCGAAVPFALKKRLDAEGRPTSAFWKHVLFRVVLLWVLGMIAQGQLLTLDPMKVSPYNNTLQTIAAGYLVAALLLLVRRRWIRIAVPIALVFGYGLALCLWGDWTEDGNLAQVVEQKCVAFFCPAGSEAFKTSPYTWFLTTPMFGFMTMCGLFSTEILSSALSAWRKAGSLAVLGAGLWAAGFAAELCGIPCNKPIFTPSFTCQAMGVCVLLLAALYVVADIWRLRRGWWLVTLFGQTALAAYMLGDVFPCVQRAAAQAFCQGLPRLCGEKLSLVLTQVVACATLAFALWGWRNARRAKR